MTTTTPYTFCSRCGSGRMVAVSSRQIVCQMCDYQHFVTPIPAACVLLLDASERLLILRRAHEPGLGKWCLPGGVIEPNETGEQAAARELREEAGIELAPSVFQYFLSGNNHYLFQDFVWPTLDLFFVATVTQAELQLDPTEVSEAQWFALDKVPLQDFAFESNAHAVRTLALRRAG